MRGEHPFSQIIMADSSHSIPLYLSPSHTCDYLPGEVSQSAFIDPDTEMTAALYEYLLSLGFRRSGKFVYKPYCDNCQQCIPCRIPIASFKASRSQKRVLKQNSDLSIQLVNASFNQEHFDLYLKYQKFRHKGGSMENFDAAAYKDFICTSVAKCQFIETRLGDKLLAIAVTDTFEKSFSAVYTFFDPEYTKRSLGSYSILKQIEVAKKQNKDYLYMGYYIKKCQKMSYKCNFKPIEMYLDNTWKA